MTTHHCTFMVEIWSGVAQGKFPKRARRHVLEWHDLHRNELLEDWEFCRARSEPKSMEPLE
ncbi:DUF4160 domain-containing protein [Thiohalocapsa halophila]|uniref:DUF4160 domain-containing protein n=1 Tax=Thiohalocapsa halophila TaxID=69359 RepID=UPI0034DAD604